MAIYSAVTHHRSYLRALSLASAYLKNPGHLRKLLKTAQSKADDGSNRYLKSARETVGIPLRMLNAYVSGEYRAIPWRSLSMLTAAVVYFVMPFDFVTDLLPLFGFMDDVALLAWTMAQLKKDVDLFLEWEADARAAENPTETSIEARTREPTSTPLPQPMDNAGNHGKA